MQDSRKRPPMPVATQAAAPKKITMDFSSSDALLRELAQPKQAGPLSMDVLSQLQWQAMNDFTTIERLIAKYYPETFADARDRGLCPICFVPGCPWPQSADAAALGYGRAK